MMDIQIPDTKALKVNPDLRKKFEKWNSFCSVL